MHLIHMAYNCKMVDRKARQTEICDSGQDKQKYAATFRLPCIFKYKFGVICCTCLKIGMMDYLCNVPFDAKCPVADEIWQQNFFSFCSTQF